MLSLWISVIAVSPVPAAFPQGVASGDVTDTSAIVWTRAGTAEPLTVHVAADEQFAGAVFSAEAAPAHEADLTVKFDVTGLSPQTTYYYRFVSAGGEVSEVGRFRTAPSPDAEVPLRFIFSGDSNFVFGPFSVLASAADEDADFFVWFGDTTYADMTAGSAPVAVDLAGYRAHYRQDRGDPHLGRLLAHTATWVGWDDHEVVNDYAGLDPATFGSLARLEAAYTAFFEYMPIREKAMPADPFRTYRSFHYGALAEFFLLDVRQYREPSARAACDGALDPYGLLGGAGSADPDCIARLSEPRTMLGAQQLAWLKDGLAGSAARYKFVVSGLQMSFMGLVPYDHWDGYDAERKELLEFIDAGRIEGVWFLATNAHMNAFNPDLGSYFRKHRQAYRLANKTVIREVIAGPIGQLTLRREALGTARALLGITAGSVLLDVILEVLYADLIADLSSLNGIPFVQTDRYAYALFEVSPETGVTVTFRGLSPEASSSTTAEAPAAATLFVAAPDAAPAVPCALFPALALAAGCTFLMTRRTRQYRDARHVDVAGLKTPARPELDNARLIRDDTQSLLSGGKPGY